MWLLSNNISSDQIWEEGVTKSGVINDYLQYLMNTPSEGLRAQGLLPEKNPIWDKSCFLTSVKSCCSGSKKESSWDFGKVGSHDCFAFCSRARQSSASHCLDRGQIWVVRQRRRNAWRGLPALSTHASREGSNWSLRRCRLLEYFGFKDFTCTGEGSSQSFWSCPLLNFPHLLWNWQKQQELQVMFVLRREELPDLPLRRRGGVWSAHLPTSWFF